MFFAAVTGLLVMLTAAPALAGHEEALRREDGIRHEERNPYSCGIAGCTDRHRGPGICFAKREYDRGHALGYREGQDRGCRDASLCNPFCDGIPRRLKRFSNFFAAGYVDAYPLAYESAFYQYRPAPRRPRWISPNGGRGSGWGIRGTWSRGGWSWGRGR